MLFRSIPFGYISKTHIKVYVDGVEDTAFTWINDSMIRTSVTPAPGAVVERRRITPKEPLTDFVNSSTLNEADLDRSLIQSLYVAQEAFDDVAAKLSLASDNTWDALNKRIKNLADPVNAQDAVTKNWAETGMTSQLNQAMASAASAASSAAQATTAATNAQSAATTATNKASEASTSATNAANSAATAATKATEASTSASNAAASAATAATKAAEASTSELNAASSASAAQTSANNASTSATSAAASASAAAASASNAAASAAQAQTSEVNAAASAATATTKATEANEAATNAASSASAAASSASAASTQATNAATSASQAATDRDNARKWATEAEDVQVDDGVNPVGFSAFHWSKKAEAFAAEVVDGSIWHSGTGAPSGALGKVTDWYIDTDTGDIYEKTSVSTWTLRGNLKGPQGPAGVSWGGGFIPPHQPGLYYRSQFFFEALNASTMVPGRFYAIPFIVPNDKTYDRIAIQVSTGAAGTTARLGIYAPAYTSAEPGIQPGQLILDAGEVSTDSSGLKEIAISQQLSAGWYFLAAIFSGNPSCMAYAITTTYARMGHIYGRSALNVMTIDGPQWCVSRTYGPLPADMSAAGGYFAAVAPGIALRAA